MKTTTNPTTDRPWFPAKRYGWGWGLPLVWQGWVVYGVFALTLGAAARWIRYEPHPTLVIAWVVGCGAALLGVCLLKGERPQWRWGR